LSFSLICGSFDPPFCRFLFLTKYRYFKLFSHIISGLHHLFAKTKSSFIKKLLFNIKN